MKIKYTVMVNHSEYAVGIYDRKEDAEQMLIKLVKSDYPDDDFDSYDDAQEFSDGYYRILEISTEEPSSELTDFEKQIIECIPEVFRYMARDEDGDLCLYDVKPCRQYHKNGVWSNYKEDGRCECIPLNGIFEFVRWENDAPWKFRNEVRN